MTSTDSAALTRIAALRAVHDRLRNAVAPLTPAQLRERGYPAEWTIAQVLSHLGSGAEINLLSLEAGLTGQAPPVQADLVAIWDRWNAKSPDEQAADALKSDAILVERFESLDADQRTRTFTNWSGPVDLNGLASSRLSETAVHGWDVEVAVDPTATIAPDVVDLVLPYAARLIGFTAKPAPAARIHVVTTDPEQEHALVLGEKAALEAWDGGDRTGTLTLPAEAFLRLIYGRLDPEHTPTVTATDVDLDALRAVFPGF